MTNPMKDENFEHRARIVYLTTMWTPEGPVGPMLAAQCSGRIGWKDYRRRTHPFVEMYRGDDQEEAQALCDAHNAEFHGGKD